MSPTTSSNEFSLFSLLTAGLALLNPLAAAYTQPKGAAPSGNPIYTPSLDEVVSAGKTFNITWDPTTTGTVTLVLLKGPSSNAVPQYAIVEKIPNSGSYTWTPSKDLAPSGDTGYGIELIVDATGQYQYSTQFGISNADWSSFSSSSLSSYKTSSSSSSSSSTSTATTTNSTSTETSTSSTWASHHTSSATSANVTTATTLVTASTGWLPHNSSIVSPTGAITKPSTLPTVSATTAASTSSAASTTLAHPSSSATTASGAGTVVANVIGIFAIAAVVGFAS